MSADPTTQAVETAVDQLIEEGCIYDGYGLATINFILEHLKPAYAETVKQRDELLALVGELVKMLESYISTAYLYQASKDGPVYVTCSYCNRSQGLEHASGCRTEKAEKLVKAIRAQAAEREVT